MKTVSLICHNHECRSQFTRPKKEFERRQREGHNTHYCGRKCAALANHNFIVAGRKNGNVDRLQPFIPQRDEFTPFRQHLRSARARDKENCTLTLTDLKTQWELQDGLCAYTEIPMGGKGATQPSVDRIDSSIGYTHDNIQYVCKAINLAKSTLSDKEMRDFVQLIRG